MNFLLPFYSQIFIKQLLSSKQSVLKASKIASKIASPIFLPLFSFLPLLSKCGYLLQSPNYKSIFFLCVLNGHFVAFYNFQIIQTHINYSDYALIFLVPVKTRGLPSNSLNGNITSSPPDDLVHLSGPVTEDAIIRVLQQRSMAGENYVCTMGVSPA